MHPDNPPRAEKLRGFSIAADVIAQFPGKIRQARWPLTGAKNKGDRLVALDENRMNRKASDRLLAAAIGRKTQGQYSSDTSVGGGLGNGRGCQASHAEGIARAASCANSIKCIH